MSDEEYRPSSGSVLTSHLFTLGIITFILYSNLPNFANVFHNPAIANLSFWSVVGISYLFQCILPTPYRFNMKK